MGRPRDTTGDAGSEPRGGGGSVLRRVPGWTVAAAAFTVFIAVAYTAMAIINDADDPGTDAPAGPTETATTDGDRPGEPLFEVRVPDDFCDTVLRDSHLPNADSGDYEARPTPGPRDLASNVFAYGCAIGPPQHYGAFADTGGWASVSFSFWELNPESSAASFTWKAIDADPADLDGPQWLDHRTRELEAVLKEECDVLPAYPCDDQGVVRIDGITVEFEGSYRNFYLSMHASYWGTATDEYSALEAGQLYGRVFTETIDRLPSR